jgi:hypothetical protein
MNQTRTQIPKLQFFALAAVCNRIFPKERELTGVLSHAARIGLTATLYLIGTGISVATLKRVGHRPIASGRDSVADNFYGFLVADPRRLDCPVIPAFASPGSLS